MNATELVLVPRAYVSSAERRQVGLFGAIPRGVNEGVLSLVESAGSTSNGLFVSASTLRRGAVSLVHTPNDDGLTLFLAGQAPMRFRRAGGVDVARLQSVSIIGHRGLSLGRQDLMNTLVGIQHCWLFGCSGVELDVTVPYAKDRRALPGAMRVFHPPDLRSEVTGFDSVPESALLTSPDLPTALRATRESGLPFVYVDPKLRWIVRRDRQAARAALDRIVAAAVGHLAQGSSHRIAIGSETSGPGEAADIIEEMRRQGHWPREIAWALEITRATDPQNAYERLHTDGLLRPDIGSFNLLRIRGGGGGLLRLFLSSVSARMEGALRQTSQPFIYWTAHEEGQFDAALAALDRMTGSASREIGIITPYPHRLAFYLAVRRPRS